MPVADGPPRIVILGAGPIGLETALYARYLGYPVRLLEKGSTAAAHVLAWGHVRLFTPFRRNATPLAVAALEAQDASWHCPAGDDCLSGAELYHRYWGPLAQSDLVASVLQCDCEVVAVGRQGWLKPEGVGDPARSAAPFALLVRHADGTEESLEADVVIDCTGTYGQHNWLGGIPVPGETEAAAHIEYGLPDVLGAARARYAGKQTLLVGAGYSAATAVSQLVQLPESHITWATRSSVPLQRIPGDTLPERDALAQQANALADGSGPSDSSSVTHLPGTTVTAVTYRPESDDFEVQFAGQQTGPLVCDRIVANVGYHPQGQLYSELQMHACYATDGPMQLAAQLAAQSGTVDCLEQTAGGPDSLRSPEANFYLLGSKSYGRNTQFLLSQGFQQIRDLFTILGEREDLDLYATMPAIK